MTKPQETPSTIKMKPAPPPPQASPAARLEALALPLTHRFRLGETITPVQKAFLDERGYLIFEQVATQAELDELLAELDRVQAQWLREKREKVYGIPLFVGEGLDGEPFIQRFSFTSMFSPVFHRFVRDDRFAPIRSLIGEGARVGDEEKDGVVVNRNLNTEGSAYPSLGWHTDGLRSIFYGRMPGPMLNVGLHFDRVREEDGGLRVLPGSHRQNFVEMLTRKIHFLDHRPDKDEIAIETEPGDLTVHDGRMWHRVARSPHIGERSLRRTMYVPYIVDEYSPKSESSPTPLYHTAGVYMRRAKRKLKSLKRRSA